MITKRTDSSMDKFLFEELGTALYVWAVALNDVLYGKLKANLRKDQLEDFDKLLMSNLFIFSGWGIYITLNLFLSVYPQIIYDVNEDKVVKQVARDIVNSMSILSKKKVPQELKDQIQEKIVDHYKEINDSKENIYFRFVQEIISNEFSTKELDSDNAFKIIDYVLVELKKIVNSKTYPLRNDKDVDDLKFKSNASHFYNLQGDIVNLADSCKLELIFLNKHRSLLNQELLCKVSGSRDNLWDFKNRLDLLQILSPIKVT